MSDEDQHVASEPIVERHPFRYPWKDRFPGARRVAGGEGGTVYAAEAENGYWLITDEGGMVDLLDAEEDADLLDRTVTLRRYGSRSARDEALGDFRHEGEWSDA